MALYGDFDRYYDDTQRAQKLALCDPAETIQSKLPVENGEIILTQTRLYLATGERTDPPNVRLERARPQTFPDDRYLEIAPRMGAELARGQSGIPFLEMVDHWRKLALERVQAATLASRGGIRARYDSILEKATGHGARGERRKMKDTLRNLHAAAPDRTEAAARLGETYLEEGNHRAALLWLARGRAFDERFDRALTRMERPCLPSREWPPPEAWMERNLAPLLLLPEGDGPDRRQRARIRAALERIAAFRAASGKATPLAWLTFLLAVVGWVALLYLAPWPTLAVTTVAAVVVGAFAGRRSRGRRPSKR